MVFCSIVVKSSSAGGDSIPCKILLTHVYCDLHKNCFCKDFSSEDSLFVPEDRKLTKYFGKIKAEQKHHF